MSRRITRIAAAILLAALLISAAAPAFAAPKRRVVMLLAPYISWSDVVGGSMPNLERLAGTSLLANMNVRAGAAGGITDANRGALVLSAGAPLTAEDGLSAFGASETVGMSPARDLYTQLFGVRDADAAAFFLGRPRQVAANLDASFDSSIGVLASAVHAEGLLTAAIGNGDPGRYVEPVFASRPAGVVAADENGIVDLGDVSSRMLLKDPAAPFGVRADVEAILAEYRSVMARSAVGLVVVDPGDLVRADEISSQASAEAIAAARATAMRTTDEVLGGIIEGLGPDDVVMVVVPVPSTPANAPAPFTPFLLAGPDGPGLATAASTHLDGVLAVTDVSSTALSLLGFERPAEMVGSDVRPSSLLLGGSAEERIAYLDKTGTTAMAAESVRGGVVNAFILLAVVVLLGSAVILYRGPDGTPRSLCRVALGALLVVACMPLAGLLQYVAWPWPSTSAQVLAGLGIGTVLIWIAVTWLGRGRPATVPLIAVTSITVVTLLIDQWLGAPLSFVGLFGYSPLLGARYYGLGNEMAGLILGSMLVAVTLMIDTWRDARWTAHLRVWGWPVIGVVILATSAAPFWGANIGTIAWMTVAFIVGWLMLQGRRVWTWRNLAIIVALVAVILAGVIAIDLAGAPGTETHLGRAVFGTRSGGLASFWTIVVRKAETNLRVLGRTNWTWLLVAVLTLLGYMRWRPRGEFAAMLREYPAFSAAVAASLFGGVAGYFTEDSGIIIPALLLIPVGVSVLYLMLSQYKPSAVDAP